MKSRKFGFIFAAASVTALSAGANAQRFYLASDGDALNGAAGTEISGNIQVDSTKKFAIEVWYQNTGGQDSTGLSVGMEIGYDQSSAAGPSPSMIDHKLNLDGTLAAPGSSGSAFISGSTDYNQWLNPVMRGGHDAGFGTNNPDQGNRRPAGVNVSEGILVTPVTIHPGHSIKLLTLKFDATAMGYGTIYGDDATENGLIVYKDMDNSGIAPGFGESGINNYFVGSQKYAVQLTTVPEPLTMIALGAGVAALLRRRRKAS